MGLRAGCLGCKVLDLGGCVCRVTQTPDQSPSSLNRDSNREPNIKALKRRGFLNHGSTLMFRLQGVGTLGIGESN